jgi:hypothetical protein
VDQNAIEELFERNADMRLLEFRHNEPGKGAPPNKRTPSSFGAESIMASTPDAIIEKSPRLRVTIAAAPASGVIPGAVVGVAIDVFNDGNAPAPESKLLVSAPIESEFRVGTLRVDGREVQAPEQLFGSGLPIARLPGSTSLKVTFQLAILPGVNALYLQPRLQADGVPVVGTPGMSIKRGVTAGPSETPRPFYELDDEETEEVAAQSAEPILPPVLPPALPLAVEAPPVAAAPHIAEAPAPVLEVPKAVEVPAAVEPPKAPEVAPPPTPVRTARVRAATKPAPEPPPPPLIAEPEREPESVPAVVAKPVAQPALVPKAPPRPAAAPEERMIRYRSIGVSDIGLLERLFASDPPGVIAHFIMISSVACTEPGSGEDTSGYALFLRRDIELLGRALVHSRMGKAPQYRIAQGDLDGLSLTWDDAPQQAFPPQRRLRRDLRKPELAAIGKLMQSSERDASLRTRIALLALAGTTLDGTEKRAAAACTAALRGYCSAALAWLVPLCVASAGAETFVVPNAPPALDDAGRKLVTALKAAMTS